MSRLGTAGVAGAVIALMSGCSLTLNPTGPAVGEPACLQPSHGRIGDLNGSLVLSAQSVPSAALIPCMRARLPAGWTVRDFTAQHGRTRVWLNLGTQNVNALTMTFTRSCDVEQARRMPSDETGTDRFDDAQVDASGYRGSRFYTFAGGCVAYQFDVRGTAARQAVRTISRSLAFVDRRVLRRYVDAYSNGRFHLDPSPGG